MKKIYHKFECENCGAPLSRTEHPGEYHCDFCGSIYVNENHSDVSVEKAQSYNQPKVITPSYTPELFTEPFPSVTPTTEKRLVKKGVKALFVLPLIAIICGMLAFCNRNNESQSNQTASNTLESQPTPIMALALPTGPVMVGEVICYQGWEIALEPSFIVSNDEINFAIIVTNWIDHNEVISFKPNNIQVMDDAGNEYSILSGNCDQDELFFEREISFESQQIRQIETSNNWCRNTDEIPTFSGTIVPHATKLYIIFTDFGPFTQLIYQIDL